MSKKAGEKQRAFWKKKIQRIQKDVSDRRTALSNKIVTPKRLLIQFKIIRATNVIILIILILSILINVIALIVSILTFNFPWVIVTILLSLLYIISGSFLISSINIETKIAPHVQSKIKKEK